MKRTSMALVTLISAASLGLGCQSGNINPKGNVELHMGQATRAMKERMIADPHAGERNVDPVTGLDANTARGVLENYKRNEQSEVQDQKARDRVLFDR